MDISFSEKLENYLVEYRNWSLWQTIILGQILSIILCVLSFLSNFLATNIHLYIPTSQSYIHYIMMMAFFTTFLSCRKGEKSLFSILKAKGFRYILISFIDVQANTLLITSYQFTSITSINLLYCGSVPVAISLSCLTLGIRFRFVHILGISLCLISIGTLIWADIEENTTHVDKQTQLVGDMLCLGGTILFAVITVLQELIVKKIDCLEYLGMLGLFGSLICGIQMFLLEKTSLINANWENKIVLVYLGAYAVVQFIFFSLLSLVLKRSGAVAVHLFLLTTDFYSLIFGIVFLNYKFHALYFLSFFLTMTGIYVFSIKRTDSSNSDNDNGNNVLMQQQNQQYNQNGIFAQNNDLASSSNIAREYTSLYSHESYEMSSTSRNFSSASNGAEDNMVLALNVNSASAIPPSPLNKTNNSTFTSFYGG